MSNDFAKTRFKWLDQVRRDTALTDFDVRVAYELASFVNRATEEAFPSHATIAKRLNASRSGVKKSIQRLIHNGYLEVRQGRGRTHANHYRLRLKKGPSEDRLRAGINNGSKAKRVLDGPKKGPGEAEKGSPSGPQNSSNNTLNNSLSGEDEPAGSLASAHPTGALARRPDSEQAQAETAVQAKNGGNTPSAHSRADRQRCLNQIAGVIGWDHVVSLTEEDADALCQRWEEKTIDRDYLLAQFQGDASAAAVRAPAAIGEHTDPAKMSAAARGKKTNDCTRAEFEALLAAKRARVSELKEKSTGG